MILADTGYFIALSAPTDQHFERAVAWTRAIGSERLLVTEYVLLETMNALSRSDLRQRAVDIADAVKGSNQFIFVPSSEQVLLGALGEYRSRADKSWSLTDCMSFQIMREKGITAALAHDHHFEQAGFDALLRREP